MDLTIPRYSLMSIGDVVSLLNAFHHFIRYGTRYDVAIATADSVFKRLMPDSIHVCGCGQWRVGRDGDGPAREQLAKS